MEGSCRVAAPYYGRYRSDFVYRGVADKSWHLETSPGVPQGAFINDVRASAHDASTVYVALDARKVADASEEADFSPYLLNSTDRGRSWTSVASDLPGGEIRLLAEPQELETVPLVGGDLEEVD